jgi:hypothetical protein
MKLNMLIRHSKAASYLFTGVSRATTSVTILIIFFLFASDITGDAALSGLSDVNGTGQLATGSKGSAEWMIIPYSSAAPTSATVYKIGGTLSYVVNGDKMTIPLFPDSVTVQPDPRLRMFYFLEKYVFSTNAVKPQGKDSLPFVR